jgi:hypothetical protein
MAASIPLGCLLVNRLITLGLCSGVLLLSSPYMLAAQPDPYDTQRIQWAAISLVTVKANDKIEA